MKYEIKSVYTVSGTHEISVDHNGNNYLVIFGRHVNGWFIAILNWQICVEAAHPTDTFYNTERLHGALKRKNAASAIAEAIRDCFEVSEHYQEIAKGDKP